MYCNIIWTNLCIFIIHIAITSFSVEKRKSKNYPTRQYIYTIRTTRNSAKCKITLNYILKEDKRSYLYNHDVLHVNLQSIVKRLNLVLVYRSIFNKINYTKLIANYLKTHKNELSFLLCI